MRKILNATTNRRDHVASLEKGLQALTCFGRYHTRLTVTDVARLTEVSAASARRSLLTLQTMGYLDSDGKHFWMQSRVLLLAHSFLASRPMPSLAQPLLDALSERTRESASLGQLLDDDVIIIARSTARRSLSTGLGIGSRLPAYASATGRVLLAGLPAREAHQRLADMARVAWTPHTTTGLEPLQKLLAQCRHQGWALSNEELEPGVRSMAVPVRDRSGTVVAAMSIVVRAERMHLREFQQTLLAPLMRARDTLETHLYPN